LGTFNGKLGQLHPDLVLLQVFADDALRPFPVSRPFASFLHYSGFAKLYFALKMMRSEDAEAFRATYATLIETCRRANVPVVVWVAEYPPETRGFIEDYNR